MLQGRWLLKHRFVQGEVKIKRGNTARRQEEAVKDQTLETLFNDRGLVPRWKAGDDQ